MKYQENINALGRLPIDLMGMIFYEKSPRYVDHSIERSNRNLKLVGVFVDAGTDFITEKTQEYGLDFIQLHGNESPGYCKAFSQLKPVIKAFSISDKSDFEKTMQYENICEYFLFDTKTPQYGGSGQKFDWQILNEYKANTPFLLSGGISADDAEAIKNIRHPLLAGVDLNSRFEIKPGEKDIELLEKFIKELRYEQD